MSTPATGGHSPRLLGGRLDAGWVAMLVLMVMAAIVILYLGRDFTFYSDEWFFVLYRDGNSWENVLAGHGGHLSLFPVLLFTGLFKTVGLDSYWVYRVAALASVLLCSFLVYVLARRRVGSLIALAPAGLLLVLGSGWADILRPFQIVFTAAIACGLMAILMLDRDDLKGDVASCAFLVAGVCWSGAAVPFIVGISAGLIVKGRFWRRVWVPLIPAAIYPLWAPKYSDVHTDYADNLSAAPSYALRMVEAAVSGITGLPHWAAVVLLAIFSVVVVVRLRRIGRADALAWEALACGVTFWIVTALSQAQEKTPGVPRYLYVSAVFILLAALGIARGAPSRRVVATITVLFCLLAFPSNIVDLVRGADYMEKTAQLTRAELGAMQLAHQVISSTYTPPLKDLAGVTIPAAPYLAAVGRYRSSPADSPAGIEREPEFARRRADQILAMAFHIRLIDSHEMPPLGSHPPEVESNPGIEIRRRGCAVLSGIGSGAHITVPRSGLGIRSNSPATSRVSLRQFAHTFPVELGSLEGSADAILRPGYRSITAKPWVLRVEKGGGSIAVCRLTPRN